MQLINHNLIRYCQARQIAFTRRRQFRKNDNCFVERRNHDAVRKVVGRLRYDRQHELTLLNRHNFPGSGKLNLRYRYAHLHPLQLSREVAQLQSQLLRIARQKACPRVGTKGASL
jgi:hypothetical protein